VGSRAAETEENGKSNTNDPLIPGRGKKKKEIGDGFKFGGEISNLAK